MSKSGLTGSGLSIEQRLHQRGVMPLVDEVAKETGVPRALILGRSRTKSIAYARKVVCRRLRELGLSFPEIGHLIDRDHTTVMAACGTYIGAK